MRHRDSLLCSLLAIGVLAGCATDRIPVSVAFDPVAHFPARASYAWDRDSIRIPKDPLVADLHLEKLIEEVAEEAFAARGYTRARIGAASDFKLSYHFHVATFVGADASNATGALSFLLVEPESKRRVWTGWGRADFYPDTPLEERRAKLAEAMAHMLESFPPDRSGSD